MNCMWIHESRETFFKIDIADERDRQDRKWGVTQLSLDVHFRVLAEEFGEVAKALNEKESLDRVKEELIHTAACCVKMAEDIVLRHCKTTQEDLWKITDETSAS